MPLIGLLAGWKTFIVAGLMVAKSLYTMFTGDMSDGLNPPDYDLLMEGLGLGALRAGVAKK